jgi:hypothetical protein
VGGTPRPVLCIGESLVVLICERPGGIVRGGDAFVPHVGGAATNVAVHAAGGAPPVALAGGAGDDLWSRRLQRRLREEASRSRLLAPARRNGDSRRVRRPRPGRRARVPDLRRWHRSGHGRAWTGLDEAVGAASSLVLGSNAMVGRRARGGPTHARDVRPRGGPLLRGEAVADAPAVPALAVDPTRCGRRGGDGHRDVRRLGPPRMVLASGLTETT